MTSANIKKIHMEPLGVGETSAGPADGETLLATKTYSDLNGSGRARIYRLYEDDTVLPEPIGWQPADEASLGIWLDASDAATITDAGAGKVSAWADKSGNGTNFAQSDGAQRPTTGTRTLNSLNVIDFAEAENFDLTGYSWSSETFQFIFAAEMDTVNNANDSFLRGGGGASWFNFRAGFASNFNSYLDMFGSGNVDVSGSSLGDQKGAAHIFSLVFDKATGALSVYVDGELAGTEAAGYQTAINGSQLHLMGENATVDTADGAFAELHKFENADTAIRQKAEGYLAHKWGLVTNLPAGHPYKAAAPGA